MIGNGNIIGVSNKPSSWTSFPKGIWGTQGQYNLVEDELWPINGYSFNEYRFDNTDASSYSFTNMNVGRSQPNRFCVFPIFLLGSNGITTPNLTGGIVYTRIVGPIISNSVGRTFLFKGQPLYTVGSTLSLDGKTIETFGILDSVASLRCYFSSYSLYGYSYVESDLQTSSNSGVIVSSASVTVNTKPNDVVIAFAQYTSSGNPEMTWTGVTEDYDVIAESARRVSSASTLVTTGGPLEVGFSTTGDITSYEMCAIVFSKG